MSTFEKDNQTGLNAEKEVLKKLKEINKFFKEYDKDNIYSIVDFYINTKTKKYLCELKNRKCRLRTYPDTLMPLNKLKFIQQDNVFNGIFLFNFTNGLYFIKTSDLIENENYYLADFLRNKRSDFNDVKKLYLHIDVKYLKPIEKLIL